MVVQTELAPREGLPPKGIAVRISLVPKAADARKVTEARMRADLKANGVPRVIVVQKVAVPKGIVVRISLAPKMAEGQKGIEDRMRADLKANVAPMVIAVPKVAAPRVNVAKGIVALRETVVRMVRVAR